MKHSTCATRKRSSSSTNAHRESIFLCLMVSTLCPPFVVTSSYPPFFSYRLPWFAGTSGVRAGATDYPRDRVQQNGRCARDSHPESLHSDASGFDYATLVNPRKSFVDSSLDFGGPRSIDASSVDRYCNGSAIFIKEDQGRHSEIGANRASHSVS